MRRLFLLSRAILLSLLLLTSCGEGEEDCFTTETIDATLVWTGDYALDGCGYILVVGEAEHKPENEQNIPYSYKTTSPTAVEAKIINYGRQVTTCMTGVEMTSIKVLSLRTT